MNRQQAPVFREVLLAGGGHSHALLIRNFGMHPVPGVRLVLVSPDPLTPYSGMLPGHLAGHYAHADMHIDLVRLCQWAGVRFVQDQVTGLDLAGHAVRLAGRPPLHYDLLSLDTGSTPAHAVPGVAEHAIPVKPIAGFLARWQQALAALRASATQQHLVVVGGGAGSVEALLALAQAVAGDATIGSKPRFTLVTRSAELLTGYPARVRATALAQCRARGIDIVTNCEIRAVTAGWLHAQGAAGAMTLPFEQLFWCTQAAAPAWLQHCGLALNEEGFVRVNAALQSVSHPEVFAAGDLAHFDPAGLPKAGVYAVRQAPVLAANLRHALLGEPLEAYRPQHTFLSLLALGERRAVGSRGGLAFAGAWVWRWKDRIDRAFMRKFQQLPPPAAMPQDPVPAQLVPVEEHVEMLDGAQRCGGCGGKLGAVTLATVLAELQGSYHPEDASSTEWPGTPLLQSIDQLKAPFDDPWRFGRIATRHALNDLFAMNARPHSALVAAGLPFAGRAVQRHALRQVLQGVMSVCEEEGLMLLGGHSAESSELTLTLSVNGSAGMPGFRKGGLRTGQLLVLGKPLGSGIVLAAHMRGLCPGPVLAAALAVMDSSPRRQAAWLAQSGVTSCTDVSGFGLLGHLAEMLQDSGLWPELDPAAIPLLPGVAELLAQGLHSSLLPQNAAMLGPEPRWQRWREHPLWPLLLDPQTSGGLLAAIAPELASAAQAQGFAVIGKVKPAA